MPHDLPYQAEYAKSGRSSCKACKTNIPQDSLRLAVMVQSPAFDGKIPNWFHYKCFWKRARCGNPDDIYNYHSLRWDDQEKIKKQIGDGGGGGASGGDAASGNKEDYSVEYAKSGKSKCRGCDSCIAKNDVRLGRKEYESQQAIMYGPVTLWHHVDCFVENRDEQGFTEDMSPTIIKGYNILKPEDKEMLISKLGEGKKGEKRKNGGKAEAGGKKAKVEETEEDKALKAQSKKLWEFRDKLTKDVSNQAMKLMLEINDQNIPAGESRILDLMSDCLLFGALDKCSECKEGQFYFTAEGYKCSGNVTEWTKCMNITKTPKRRAFKVPKEFHDVPFLKSYKYVKKERVFPKVTVSATSGLVSSSLDSADGGGTSARPLADMKFVIVGKLKKNKSDLTKEIAALGGTIVSKVDKNIAAVISNKDEVGKKSKNKVIKEAEAAEVHVVGEDFLKACKSGDVAKAVESNSIASWGSDVEKRIGKRPLKSSAKSGKRTAMEEAMFTKSVPKTKKLTVKGGAAVDPDSELEDKAHVLQESGEPLTAVLGLVDIERGTNSFYKLQALEGDNKMSYWLFRAWGRVGTTIGGNKLERCGSKDSVIRNFKQMYGEKTGNHWSDRKNFQKQPNKFYPLDMDYGQDDEDNIKQIDLASSTSVLPKQVQDIICMIFNVESMKKAMMEFEIDMKKMPLGKLSKKQIKSAYSVLTELQKLIDEGGTQTRFVDATNRFYTAVPHDFGMQKPPLLDTAEIILKKTEMLDNLLEIEVAYSLLKGGDTAADPITGHYEKLKCKMEPMDHSSDEFKRLVEYTANTHAATHNTYDLEVMDILKVNREGEAQQYRPFKSLHNKMLLWHGSRVTNFAGILSQGLRIAPPEAPVTGYMFGKGIYFADMVTKSANYCRTTKHDNISLMMLCEVACGNMYELTSSEYVNSLPKGKHSTKGIGRTCPDPKGTYTDKSGVTIPMGKGVDSSVTNSSLLYNEFIVYDVAQVNIKYLFKMKFNYKW